MSTVTSESLRTRLRELEAAADRAASAVIEAQTSHDAAIRAAVLSGDLDAPAKTEAILAATRASHARTVATVEQAKRQLADAEAAEKAELQAAARAEIETELADMLQIATDIDSEFTGLVARVMQLRAREIEARRKIRPLFGEVVGGPEFFNGLRSLATYLRATADGLQPDAPASISKAASVGAHYIRRATSHA
ncbi:hypothetical protein JYK14_07195 [Siccirubricoccus sp. KC 17139]|uniref:Uncharacterized protein n=1 Tax=Siccirubricoccus soli TaxID=2899147 RepID=A0ABT1D236_9PROT|nr:hypothetical protein [Siccirubricoccus soli]MCO6415962.1 hypothetical protein [Siccirubricoccus soli]MCP2682094.1 hypothetical protein [Siccirubricoccus soli]